MQRKSALVLQITTTAIQVHITWQSIVGLHFYFFIFIFYFLLILFIIILRSLLLKRFPNNTQKNSVYICIYRYTHKAVVFILHWLKYIYSLASVKFAIGVAPSRGHISSFPPPLPLPLSHLTPHSSPERCRVSF